MSLENSIQSSNTNEVNIGLEGINEKKKLAAISVLELARKISAKIGK